ncbi:MAG: protein-L-isoaspartate O-methyltransferase [Candidatus Bathyarchaeota archaeon]
MNQQSWNVLVRKLIKQGVLRSPKVINALQRVPRAATIAEIVAPSDTPIEKWGHVYTIERIPQLAAFAKANIENAGYQDRITVIHSDGTLGYSHEAPYDRIFVAAAGPKVPEPLVDQLKDGGVLLAPVGGAQVYQSLIRVKKQNGEVTKENLGGVAFVPLIGKHGFEL